MTSIISNQPIVHFVVIVYSLSHIQLFVTPWTVAHQAPLSVGFPRQEYWSGLLFPSLGDLPNPGIEPATPAWQAGSLILSHQGNPLYTLHLDNVLSQFYLNKVGEETEKKTN